MAKARALYLNYVNGSMIHEQTNGKTGAKFFNVSTPWSGSANGLGTIIVYENQIFPAKNRQTGEVIPNTFNIRLGYETSKRQSYDVSIVTALRKDGKAKKGAYDTVKATMSELVAARSQLRQ